jgi:hypothetical protein
MPEGSARIALIIGLAAMLVFGGQAQPSPSGPDPAAGRIDLGGHAIVAGFRFLEHRDDGAASVLRDNRSGTGTAGPMRPIGDIEVPLACDGVQPPLQFHRSQTPGSTVVYEPDAHRSG